MNRVHVWEEKVVIPTYEAGKPDKNPMFLEKRVYQGSSGRIYPHTVIENLLDMFKEVGAACGDKIKALAVASLGESVVCLDANGKILGNSLITGDPRGAEEIAELGRRKGRKEIFEITGLPPNESYSLPKLMWMDRNTNAIRDAEAILFYEDLAGYLLTGARKVSYSSAARSLAFDIRKKEW